MPTDLESMLKDFITSQKVFNKTVEEKLDKLDNLVLKVDSLAHDVKMLKIRTSPMEDKKTESLNAFQIKIDNNVRMLAQLHARWAREEKEAEIARMSKIANVSTICAIEEVKTLGTYESPTGPKYANGKII